MANASFRKNNVTRSYLSDPDRFAQIYNNAVFGGERILQADNLKELDASASRTIGLDPKEIESISKERDLLKLYEYKEEGNRAVFAVLGIESQTDVHYFREAMSHHVLARVWRMPRESNTPLLAKGYLTACRCDVWCTMH